MLHGMQEINDRVDQLEKIVSAKISELQSHISFSSIDNIPLSPPSLIRSKPTLPTDEQERISKLEETVMDLTKVVTKLKKRIEKIKSRLTL